MDNSKLISDTDAPLRRQVLTEARAMAEYAFASGLHVQATVVQAIDSEYDAGGSGSEDGDARAEKLIDAHAQLCQLVAPATPRMLVFLAGQSSGASRWKSLGSIPLIRRMLIVTVASLSAFIALSLSPYLNDPRYSHIFEAEGLPLLINELFFLSAAALGASFAGLFEAGRYVSRGNYDPRYDSTYWTKLFLGVIAGCIMATLLNVGGADDGGGDGGAKLTNGMQAAGLALLGGFSSSAVHRILFRLVETMEAMVTGNAGAQVEQQQSTLRASLQDKADTEAAKQRVQLAGQLTLLKSQLGDANMPEGARAQLNTLLGELIGKSDSSPSASPAAANPSAAADAQTAEPDAGDN